MSKLVLITGTGRSGTSTMSGSLHHLGLHVPGPYLGANESNPKGFFESRWAVRFHKQIIQGAHLHDMDGRPTAFSLAQAQITAEHRAELVRFLKKQARHSDQIVVKDPRSVWAQRLWKDAAAEAGLDIVYVSMLRHPAEVVGSRSTYYASKLEEAKRRRYETFNVVRWVNSSLVSERETRGEPRAFVSYTAMLDDWRPVMSRMGEHLGLTYNADLASGQAHPVDEFIDPGLRRLRVTWEDLDVPEELQDVAERIWEDLVELAGADGVDPEASADLDIQQERFERIFSDASAICHDAIEEARTQGKLIGAAEERDRMLDEEGRTPPPVPVLPRPRGRLIEETGGKDLLKVVAQRAAGKAKDRARTLRRGRPGG